MLLIKDYQIIVRKRIVIIITYLDLKLHPQKCTMFYFSDKLFEKKTFTICFKLFYTISVHTVSKFWLFKVFTMSKECLVFCCSKNNWEIRFYNIAL